MPLLQINTNATTYNKDSVLNETSAAVADMLGKPESYVMVILNTGMDMSFAGNHEPCAHVKLKSLGLDQTKTTAYSERLCNLVHDQLGIATDRIYIEFAGPERHMWGWDKSTF